MEATKEMIDYFYDRTNVHITTVRKYATRIYKINISKYFLLKGRMRRHDLSKYEEPEILPYVYITWFHYCKDRNIDFEIPENIKNKMKEATYHHIKNNKHHPEYHDINTTIDSFNSKDKIIDATNMTDIDIAEMVADWMAMSEEKNNNPKDWADVNINIRWKFNDAQIKQIYSLINKCWVI